MYKLAQHRNSSMINNKTRSYFNIFLNQLFQERSCLCTLKTICGNIIDCLLAVRHIFNVLIETYQICLSFGGVEPQQRSKVLLIPSVLNATKFQKLAKALPKFLVVLQYKGHQTSKQVRYNKIYGRKENSAYTSFSSFSAISWIISKVFLTSLLRMILTWNIRMATIIFKQRQPQNLAICHIISCKYFSVTYNTTFLKNLTRNIERKIIRVNNTFYKAQVPRELQSED